MEDILATIANFLGVEIGPLKLLIIATGIGYMIYVVWEDREYTIAFFGLRSVWQLYLRIIGFVVFGLVVGTIYDEYVDLEWYFDRGIVAGILVLVWFAYFRKWFFERDTILRYMVKEPALEPAWDALRKGDDQDAFTKFQSLAEAGNTGAQLNLGIMFEAGFGVQRSDSQAEFWYRKAAEKGSREAQFQLAAILAADMMVKSKASGTDEQEVSERVMEGFMWAYLAALKNHKKAKKGVKRLKRVMSHDQIETAKRMAAQKLSDELERKAIC